MEYRMQSLMKIYSETTIAMSIFYNQQKTYSIRINLVSAKRSLHSNPLAKVLHIAV